IALREEARVRLPIKTRSHVVKIRPICVSRLGVFKIVVVVVANRLRAVGQTSLSHPESATDRVARYGAFTQGRCLCIHWPPAPVSVPGVLFRRSSTTPSMP